MSSAFAVSERTFSGTEVRRVTLGGIGAQTLKYVTDLIWDNVTTWSEGFFGPKSLSDKHKQAV